MKLTLTRLKSTEKGTIGVLKLDGKFNCFTVEDPVRDVKIDGDTCIPKGTYSISLRNEGSMTRKYTSKYEFHKGMLWLHNVDNFSYVYIHVGNSKRNSEGCILVNSGVNSLDCSGSYSSVAYSSLYPVVADAIENGEQVIITVK